MLSKKVWVSHDHAVLILSFCPASVSAVSRTGPEFEEAEVGEIVAIFSAVGDVGW